MPGFAAGFRLADRAFVWVRVLLRFGAGHLPSVFGQLGKGFRALSSAINGNLEIGDQLASEAKKVCRSPNSAKDT